MIYNLDENLVFAPNSVEKEMKGKNPTLYQQMLDLRVAVSRLINPIKLRFKKVYYVYNHIRNLDAEQLQLFPDENFFYDFGNIITNFHLIWNSSNVQEITGLYAQLQNKNIEFDAIFAEVWRALAIANRNMMEKCVSGNRFQLLAIDVCLPVIASYRELIYNYSSTPEKMEQEANLRISYNEKMLDAVDMLKEAPENDIFFDLSSQVQDTYEMWMQAFNHSNENAFLSRQEQVQILTQLISEIKNEINKIKTTPVLTQNLPAQTLPAQQQQYSPIQNKYSNSNEKLNIAKVIWENLVKIATGKK